MTHAARIPSRRDLLLGAACLTLAVMADTPKMARAQNAAPPTPDHDALYDRLLGAYVTVGADGVNRVDYARWRGDNIDRRQLDAYILALSERRPSAMARAEAFAFWGNLYNAVTLKVILDRYPVASIRDIKSEGSIFDLSAWIDPKAWLGPWRQKRVTVEGRRLSLDDIEHEIMRPTFKDPRVHYVVNCASIGCPNLMPRGWRAATLEADLDAAATAFINHPRGAAVLPNGTLRVSSIYRWFIADFGGDDAGVIAHLKRYAGPELSARLANVTRIGEDQYDWTLNRVVMSASRG